MILITAEAFHTNAYYLLILIYSIWMVPKFIVIWLSMQTLVDDYVVRLCINANFVDGM